MRRENRRKARSTVRRRRPPRQAGPLPVSTARGGSARIPYRPVPKTPRTVVLLAAAPRRSHETQCHIRIERVAPLGPVHGDREQAGFKVLQDGFVAHEGAPFVV